VAALTGRAAAGVRESPAEECVTRGACYDRACGKYGCEAFARRAKTSQYVTAA